MKKIYFLLCTALLCLASIFILASCDADLDSPGEIILDPATLTISWDKVSGAYGYSVKIGDVEKTTKATS